jgi:capsular exopolysaccharide synthesis family protein
MQNQDNQKEIDLMKYWGVIVKRKWVIIIFTGAIIFFVGVFSFLAIPQYKSTATLLIEEGSTKMLSIEETFSYQTPVVRDLRFFNTQLRLIRSKSLAERVVRKMNLLSRPEYGAGKERKSLIASIKNLVKLKWLTRKKTTEGTQSKPQYRLNPYSGMAGVVRSKIEVNSIRDTKLVEVSYTSPYPALSAELVNTLAEEFIDFSVEKRYENTQQASDFLSEQISNLREDLSSKERELQQYEEDKELIFLNDQESSAINTFAALNSAYTEARIERIRTEANYRELRDLDVDALPEFVDNSAIQNLKTEYTRLKNDYQEKIKLYKPDYPDMVQLKARIDSVKDEIRKAVDAVGSEYQAALQRERNLLNNLNRQRTEVAQMKSDAIRYNSLNIEIENIQTTLSSLISKQKDTLISSRLSGLSTSNISIIDRAEIRRVPVSPKKSFNLMVGLFFGLIGGVGLCFLFEYLDNTIKGPEDVERLSSLPSLGAVSYLPPEGFKNKKVNSFSYKSQESSPEETLPEIKEIELINHIHPKIFIAEDYRTIRTSLLLSHADIPPKTIVFTSAMPQEGKSTTTANLAVAFSQLEKKVLLVDTDLRRPRLHRIFNVNNNKGLSGYLSGKLKLGDSIKTTSIENIWLLGSGLIPPNPAELLNSKRMNTLMKEVKKDFDIVLIDSPPVLAVVDSAIVSNLSDAVVIVIKTGKTINKAYTAALEELKRVKANITGVIFNEVKVGMGGYNYMSYYNYSQSSYFTQEGVDL